MQDRNDDDSSIDRTTPHMESFSGDDHRIDRMRGCARLGLVFLKVAAVIGLIWFVYSLIRGWNGGGRRGNAHQIMVRATMKDLQVALDHFHREYNRFPLTDAKDLMLRSEGDLLLSLLGRHKVTNPRAIVFITLPLAKNDKYGLIEASTASPQSNSSLKLHDHWGEKYYLALDTNNDGEVANPEVGADAEWLAKKKPPATLKTGAAIYSAGPDRDPKTWEDNITSWR
jgi:hypothetical protein